MRKYTLMALCCLTACALCAQTPKTAEAFLLRQSPLIDGHLSDSCWQDLPVAGEFVTSTPVFGRTPHCRTEVRIFYTETALHVAAWCFDPDAPGIRNDGGIRDGEPTGDWFRVSLDTWNDDRLAFDFTLTAAGVQLDARQEAGNWDARWQSAVALQTGGWTAEIRIPFAALRFPRKKRTGLGSAIHPLRPQQRRNIHLESAEPARGGPRLAVRHAERPAEPRPAFSARPLAF